MSIAMFAHFFNSQKKVFSDAVTRSLDLALIGWLSFGANSENHWRSV